MDSETQEYTKSILEFASQGPIQTLIVASIVVGVFLIIFYLINKYGNSR